MMPESHNRQPLNPWTPTAGSAAQSSNAATSATRESPAFPLAGGNNSEQLVSKLLMGFVERKISPQTIADVVQAQIFESHMPASCLSTSTCNGILEILTSAPALSDCTDIFLFMGDHPQFPQFLSPRATFGSLAYLLRKAAFLKTQSDVSRRRLFLSTLDGFARKAVAFLASKEVAPLAMDVVRLANVLKGLDPLVATLVSASRELSELREHLMVAGREAPPAPKPALYQQPLEVIAQILATPDHQLALKGTAHFRIAPELERSAWKLRHFSVCLDYLRADRLTPFQISFLVEWFFEGALPALTWESTAENPISTENQSELHEIFKSHLKVLLEDAGQTSNISPLKGVLRSLQHDLGKSDVSHLPKMMQKAFELLLLLVPLMEKNPALVSKQFAPWALQMQVAPPEARLFTRSHWQWIRQLATGQWEEDVRNPPEWVVQSASRFSAHIFRIAPSFWLQDHAHVLLEKLHLESLRPGFMISSGHFDYVEFLARSLRKKSPYFASRPETLKALRALSRLKIQEEHQLQLADTRQKMAAMDKARRLGTSDTVGNPGGSAHGKKGRGAGALPSISSLEYTAHDGHGPNAIARALSILLQVAKEASRVPAHLRHGA